MRSGGGLIRNFIANLCQLLFRRQRPESVNPAPIHVTWASLPPSADTPTTSNKPVEETPSRETDARRRDARQVLRVIRFILDLPLAKKDPVKVAEVIALLLEHGDLRRDNNRDDGNRGTSQEGQGHVIQIGARLDSGQESHFRIDSLRQLSKSREPSDARASQVYAKSTSVSAYVYSLERFEAQAHERLVAQAPAHIDTQTPEVSKAFEPHAAAIFKLLSVIYDNSQVREALEATLYLHDRLTRSEVSPEASRSTEILVVVRACCERVTLFLKDDTKLTRDMILGALRFVASHDALPWDQIRWYLPAGADTDAPQLKGTPVPTDIDVIWCLRQFSQAATAISDQHLKLLGACQDRAHIYLPSPVDLVSLEHVQIWLRTSPALMPRDTDDFEDRVLQELRQVLDGPWVDSHPELTVELTFRVVHNAGLLPWETCLELANARATHHRYVERDAPLDQWRVSVDVHRGANGTLGLAFSVVELALSPAFREQFESQGLIGRVACLCHMVQFAQEQHSRLQTIGMDEVDLEVVLREQELLARIQGNALSGKD